MYFDVWALPIAGFLIFVFWLLKKVAEQFYAPQLYYSNIHSLNPQKPIYKQLSTYLAYSALALMLLAFIDPHYFYEKPEREASEGAAIYLVLDQSGSMARSIQTLSATGQKITIPKIELLKQITADFVRGNKQTQLAGRQNDLIGIVAFARKADVLTPLTLDHQAILKKLETFDTVKNSALDGTAIAYAIYKTANTIAATRNYIQTTEEGILPAYEIKGAAIILITDGFHAPNPADEQHRFRNIDLISAAEYAKKENIHLYMVMIEPALNKEEFSAHRNIMNRVATLTGGKAYMLDAKTTLHQIYQDVDRLERSTIYADAYKDLPKEQQPEFYERKSLFPYLLFLAFFLLLAAIFWNTIVRRNIP